MKEVRHKKILDLLDQNDVMTVNDLAIQLSVTDMTIRRDLQELENENQLIRIHGGARKVENGSLPFLELSHQAKREIYTTEKKQIAKIIAQNIHDHETVFLGSGSTIELVYDYLNVNYAKIMTNSIHVFNKFKYDDRFDLVLTGGTYRSKTGSFTGTFANDLLSNIYVKKAFIGVNAINNFSVFNANEDEGVIQQVVLNNATEKYIVANHQKLNKSDFYQFYDLNNVDFLITDKKIPTNLVNKYSKWVKIIK